MNYTNDEIEQTLSEMGYAGCHDSIEAIRRELLCSDAVDDDTIVHDIFDPLMDLFDYIDNPPQEIFDKFPEIQELINTGRQKLDDLYHEIGEIDEEIAAALDDCDPQLRESIIQNLSRQEEEARNCETLSNIYEEEEEPSPSTKDKNKPLTKDKSLPKSDSFQPTKSLPAFEFDDENQPILLDRNTEIAIISEVLKQTGAVRVNCPPPGKAPFKYDPVKRNAQYREAWKKYPAPGEKRRASLRWKIRDIMTKRDIPHLRLVPNVGFKERPDWNE
jgi:hypothetical protein